MVGNEVWEQWGANTGDSQQLLEQTETGGFTRPSLPPSEWSSVHGTLAQVQGRQVASWSVRLGTGAQIWASWETSAPGLYPAPNCDFCTELTPWGPPD